MARLKKGLLRITYLVSGKNIEYLPEFLHRKKVSVIKFLKESESLAKVTIDVSDVNKFFAICKNMCYNKKVVGYRGILCPLTLFINKVGLCLGIALFILISTLLNGVCLGVKIQGSGVAFESETRSLLKTLGVSKYSLFSKIDYKQIENKILSSNPNITFVSVYKEGNFLVVDSQITSSKIEVLGENSTDIVSVVDGVIEEIVVLRGTPLVKVGDKVKKGDILVGAYSLGKEEGETFPTFTVARVKIIETVEFSYKPNILNDREIELAYALAEFNVGGEIIEKSHKVDNDVIVVTLSIRRTITGG